MDDEPRWQDDALCRDRDPDLWFPDANSPRSVAVRVCAECPVIEQCRNFALANGETHGVWGGLYARELVRMRVGLRDTA